MARPKVDPDDYLIISLKLRLHRKRHAALVQWFGTIPDKKCSMRVIAQLLAGGNLGGGEVSSSEDDELNESASNFI